MDDLILAKKYLNKARSSADRGIEFSLTLSEYKKLLSIKRCQYTSIPFCDDDDYDHFSKRSIDRIDNSKGYIKGNVVVVCQGVNLAKAIWENPENPLTPKMIVRIINKIERLSTKKEKRIK